jgi:hypothetical protein
MLHDGEAEATAGLLRDDAVDRREQTIRPKWDIPLRHHLPYICGEGFTRTDTVCTILDVTMPDNLHALRTRLQTTLAKGLAEEPLAHAEQVAEIAAVLHEAFEPAGFSATLVGGSAIEIHAPGIYLRKFGWASPCSV